MESTSEDAGSDCGRLRHLVALSGCTPNALSKAAGLSPAHVGMVLRGDIKKGVSVETARALARVTGCAVGWLLTGEGVPPSEAGVRSAVEHARRRRTEDEPHPTVANDNQHARVSRAANDPGTADEPTGTVIVREGYDQTGGL